MSLHLLWLCSVGALVIVAAPSFARDDINTNTVTTSIVLPPNDALQVSAYDPSVIVPEAQRKIQLGLLPVFDMVRDMFLEAINTRDSRVSSVRLAMKYPLQIRAGMHEVNTKVRELTEGVTSAFPSSSFYFDAAAELSNLLQESMKWSKEKRYERKNIDIDDTVHRTETLFVGAQQAIMESPSGIYLDWAKARFSGALATQELTHVIAVMRALGYGTLMKLGESMIGALEGTGRERKLEEEERSGVKKSSWLPGW